MYNSMKWWQRGSESSQHSPAYCLWNTLEWRSLANSHWKNSFQRTVFTDYLHCLFRLYIFQVNTMWSLCMKDFFQRKILGQLACCFFLNSLEALMQISWEHVPVSTDHHHHHHWNLEILSGDLIQVFHCTSRKWHRQLTCCHPAGHGAHSGQAPFFPASGRRKQVDVHPGYLKWQRIHCQNAAPALVWASLPHLVYTALDSIPCF